MKKCGIVMKGGVTSGIVYPLAIHQLSQEYEFSHIGGTSAGAIGAAFVAAAEFRRQFERSNNGDPMIGFESLVDLADYLSKNLKALFQPAKPHQKTFKLVLELLDKQPESIKGWLWKLFWHRGAIKKTLENLDSTAYGLCPGLTTEDNGQLGLSDFLNERLQYTAGLGLKAEDNPLTIGDLKNYGIKLHTLTTNVSQRTPIKLPDMKSAYILKEDGVKYLPAQIRQYVARWNQTRPIEGIENKDRYFRLPTGDDMPVFLLMRLSLSFPILLSAFPIYRTDFSKRHLINPLRSSEQPLPVERCLLSDGGIISNFPVHLFDAAIPSIPIFGISLEAYHKDRQDKDNPENPDFKNRAYLPTRAGQGQTVPINSIDSPMSFLMQIFHSAQTWQDFHQTRLPGYRERVVRLYLKDDSEGGLKLDMTKDQIINLTKIGKVAGDVLLENFDMDAHRWRRLLSSYEAMEKSIESLSKDFYEASETVDVFLDRVISENNFNRLGYEPDDLEKIKELSKRIRAVADLSNQMKPTLRNAWDGSTGMPKPAASLKVTSSAFLESDD